MSGRWATAESLLLRLLLAVEAPTPVLPQTTVQRRLSREEADGRALGPEPCFQLEAASCCLPLWAYCQKYRRGYACLPAPTAMEDTQEGSRENERGVDSFRLFRLAQNPSPATRMRQSRAHRHRRHRLGGRRRQHHAQRIANSAERPPALRDKLIITDAH